MNRRLLLQIADSFVSMNIREREKGRYAMNYDILTILQEKAPTFSKGQRRIAQYITEAYDKAAFMTANRLGKTVGVSESTVVRFAVDLGFDARLRRPLTGKNSPLLSMPF